MNQFYGADILMEYVIRGNAAVLKCSIPSFVADFVRVESWIDEEGTELRPSENYGITAESKILATATLCGGFVPIPSYLQLFYIFPLLHTFAVVNQFYEAEIMTEYVIRGNAAVLKCSIPSFVADFVRVESWNDDEGNVLSFSDNYGARQRCSSSSFMLNFHQLHSQ